jgi:hypothetical protein
MWIVSAAAAAAAAATATATDAATAATDAATDAATTANACRRCPRCEGERAATHTLVQHHAYP